MSADAPELATVDRVLAEETPLPRDNGELVFEEPWQGRALSMGVVALKRSGASWTEFRHHLAAAIAAHPRTQSESDATAYYTAWLDALEALLTERGVLDKAKDSTVPRSGLRNHDYNDRRAEGTAAR
jgi:nitrile hydratase accessory protein